MHLRAHDTWRDVKRSKGDEEHGLLLLKEINVITSIAFKYNGKRCGKSAGKSALAQSYFFFHFNESRFSNIQQKLFMV